MLKIFKQPNFPTTLFVISSLMSLVLVGSVAFFIKIAIVNPTEAKNYGNNTYRENQNDPFITVVADSRSLDRPKIDGSDPMLGDPTAPVSLVEYSDATCEYCQNQEKTLKQLLAHYPGKIKLVWKDYPETKQDSISWQAAMAGRCAAQQNQFWPYHDLMFQAGKELTVEKLQKLAEQLRLDGRKFKQCLDSDEAKKSIQNNITEANDLDIKGTPYLFVGQQESLGETDLENLRQMVDQELNRIQ